MQTELIYISIYEYIHIPCCISQYFRVYITPLTDIAMINTNCITYIILFLVLYPIIFIYSSPAYMDYPAYILLQYFIYFMSLSKSQPLMPTNCFVLRTPTILPNIRISRDCHPTFMLIFGRVPRSFTHL